MTGEEFVYTQTTTWDGCELEVTFHAPENAREVIDDSIAYNGWSEYAPELMRRANQLGIGWPCGGMSKPTMLARAICSDERLMLEMMKLIYSNAHLVTFKHPIAHSRYCIRVTDKRTTIDVG